MKYKPYEQMTKAELLAVINEIPQGYWPPRPTRQDKYTLLHICIRYRNDRLKAAGLSRNKAYEAANQRHPLPISGGTDVV